jgi:hypothetical protein
LLSAKARRQRSCQGQAARALSTAAAQG